jgi:hypothetical protein
LSAIVRFLVCWHRFYNVDKSGFPQLAETALSNTALAPVIGIANRENAARRLETTASDELSVYVKRIACVGSRYHHATVLRKK